MHVCTSVLTCFFAFDLLAHVVVDLFFRTSPRSERSGQSSVGQASAKNAMFAKMKKSTAPMPSPLGSFSAFSAPVAGPGTAAGSVAAAAAAAVAAVKAATAVAAVSSPPRASNNYDDWDDEDNDLQVPS